MGEKKGVYSSGLALEIISETQRIISRPQRALLSARCYGKAVLGLPRGKRGGSQKREAFLLRTVHKKKKQRGGGGG